MKLVGKNITLENVKKSNYWDLISILVWNHYSEKKYQDESCIEIKESWYGKGEQGSSSHTIQWDNPLYSDEKFIRTLGQIVIVFKRSDYVTYIYIDLGGNVHCFGQYLNNKEEFKVPNYDGIQRNLDITNWMISNGFIEIIE